MRCEMSNHNVTWSQQGPTPLDLAAQPFVPKGWEVVEHKSGGQETFGCGSVSVHYHQGQENGKKKTGNKLKEALLPSMPVLNAVVLDWLLENTQYIDEKWMDKTLVFWGTVYRSEYDSLCVRGLVFVRRPWIWGWCTLPLHHRFGAHYPAAIRA